MNIAAAALLLCFVPLPSNLSCQRTLDNTLEICPVHAFPRDKGGLRHEV